MSELYACHLEWLHREDTEDTVSIATHELHTNTIGKNNSKKIIKSETRVTKNSHPCGGIHSRVRAEWGKA